MKLMYIIIVMAQIFKQPELHKTAKNAVVQQSFDKLDSIKYFIIKYYQKQFEKERSVYPDMQIKMDTSDSGITMKQLIFKDKDYGPVRIIPTTSQFMIGKLNDDNVNDVIVSVYSTEGGNKGWVDMFVFISKNNHLYFYKKYTSYDLGICKKTKSKGAFYPSAIVHKTLVGDTHGYTKNDPGCCPSLNYNTRFKFDKGFKMISQTAL